MSGSRVTNPLGKAIQVLSDNPTPHGHTVTYPCFLFSLLTLASDEVAFPEVMSAGCTERDQRKDQIGCGLKTYGHFRGVHAGQLKTHGQARAA